MYATNRLMKNLSGLTLAQLRARWNRADQLAAAMVTRGLATLGDQPYIFAHDLVAGRRFDLLNRYKCGVAVAVSYARDLPNARHLSYRSV